jgi:hypothetical protein
MRKFILVSPRVSFAFATAWGAAPGGPAANAAKPASVLDANLKIRWRKRELLLSGLLLK